MELIQEMDTVFASAFAGFVVYVVGSFQLVIMTWFFLCFCTFDSCCSFRVLFFLKISVVDFDFTLYYTIHGFCFASFLLNFCADSLVYIKFFFLSLIAIFNFI